jgi:hypothetical protein
MHAERLVKQPISPVRGAYAVNSLVGFDIDPAVRKAATRKSDNARPCAIDNRELQIAVERCGIYQLPFHNGACPPS